MTMPTPTPPFRPPTAEQVEEHLREHPPRRVPPIQMWAPIAAVAMLTLVGLLIGGAAGLVLPFVGIAAMMVMLSKRVRDAQAMEAAANHAQELAMLRHDAQALRRAWTLLPESATRPLAHARLIALLAQLLDRVGSHEAALVAYDYLLEHLPDEHGALTSLRLGRATSALLADRLTDADDTLRRLRGDAHELRGTPLWAQYRFVQLLQAVRTNHFADAVDEFPNVADDLRPLAVEAGYGYGLMALCHLNNRRAEAADASRGAARQCWDWATRLLPEAVLLGRHPELASVPAGLREEATP